jgi:hypothetical protein
MRSFFVVYAILTLFCVSSADAQSVNPARRQPWVYVTQHDDHQTMQFERRVLEDEPEGAEDFAGGSWEFSVNATNGTLSHAQVRVQVFNSNGVELYSSKTQLLSATGRELFHWSSIPETTMLKDFTARTVVVSSDQPLHVDSQASHERTTFNVGPGTFRELYSKRNVPVKEIECSKQSSQFGWFCGVINK